MPFSVHAPICQTWENAAPDAIPQIPDVKGLPAPDSNWVVVAQVQEAALLMRRRWSQKPKRAMAVMKQMGKGHYG